MIELNPIEYKSETPMMPTKERFEITNELFRESCDSPEQWLDSVMSFSPEVVKYQEMELSLEDQRSYFDENFYASVQEFIDKIKKDELTSNNIDEFKKKLVQLAGWYLYVVEVCGEKKEKKDIVSELVDQADNVKVIAEHPTEGTTLDHIYEYTQWIQKNISDFIQLIKTNERVVSDDPELIKKILQLATEIGVLEIPLGSATRDRLEIVQATVKDILSNMIQKGENPVVISIGSGTGRGVGDVVADPSIKPHIKQVVFIDFDPNSIQASKDLASKNGFFDKSEFISESLVKVFVGKETLLQYLERNGVILNEDSPRIVECVGMTDYLKIRHRRNLYDGIVSLGDGNGEFHSVVAHIRSIREGSEFYQQQKFMEEILNWNKNGPMYGVDKTQFQSDLSSYKEKGYDINITTDPHVGYFVGYF